METPATPSTEALQEALQLSDDLLRNIEHSEIPLANIALKASRLARLLNEFDYQQLFEYEAGGYPTTPTGVPQAVWKVAEAAGRTFQQETKPGDVRTLAFLESVEELEEMVVTGRAGLEAARDRDVSLKSANPHQLVLPGPTNQMERFGLQQRILQAKKRLASRKSFMHQYVLQKHYEIKYSGIASDAFARIRRSADSLVGVHIPGAVQKFTAVYDNLQSDNPEDWSNAVHGCRRILEDLADAVFPPTDEDRVKRLDGKEQTIKLGPSHYINRLVCFAEENSQSDRYAEIVGSHLRFLGDRLESAFSASQKGSHATITRREEADRYVVYTYMLVVDILTLKSDLE